MLSSDDRIIVRRFWQDWVLRYRSRLVLIFLLMVLVAATGGAYPAVIRHVFDVLAGGAASGSDSAFGWLDDPFIFIPCVIILLSSVKATAMYFQVLTVNSLALKITTDIQKAMKEKKQTGRVKKY